MNLQDGPWGGGNQFGNTLLNFLESKGVEVCSSLDSNDIDLILLTDPRRELQSCAFDSKDILKYILFRNTKTVVAHRINECDERKGTSSLNSLLCNATKVADHTIFIGSWLRDLHLAQGMHTKENSVILNGADASVFTSKGYEMHHEDGKFRLVTHHWGGGWLKGFDIYQKLDSLLESPKYRELLDFTYIGNVPDDFTFKNARHMQPLCGHELAKQISMHHVYLTASQNEPAGMHHIEGALCGLPLLYRESGALPEYCNGFGLGFKEENFEVQLHRLLDEYPNWAAKMADYPHTAHRMCQSYYDLFVELVERREELIAKRQFKRQLHWVIPTLMGRST